MDLIRKLVFAFGVAVLLAGLILLILSASTVPSPKFDGRLEDLLAKSGDIPEWTVTYLPIANSLEERAKVDELLNYDQGIFVNYSKAGLRISVYLAYWRPGKMPVRAIANHTPDVCWVKAGWQCILREELSALKLNKRIVSHTEYRAYTLNDLKEYVVFWQVGGGRVISYQTGGRPPWYAIFTDVFSRQLDQQPEQFFIRISSNQPREQFWDTDVVRTVLSRAVLSVSIPQ